MIKKTILFPLALLLVSLSYTASYGQEDVEGSEDHSMISRYEGSVIKGYEHVDYDRIQFPSGFEKGSLEIDKVEGEVTKILYAAPEGLSVFQVQRNYQIALKDAGFEIVYECFGGMDEIPRAIYTDEAYSPGWLGTGRPSWTHGDDASYFLARLPGEDGDIYVSAHTLLSDKYDGRPATALQVLEEKPMDTGKVEVEIDSEAMKEDIEESGSVRIYGIHFDTDKATIKGKSESTLAEIANLLEQQSDLNLRVVGHTDATGSLEYNMDLSMQRAEAVVEFLTSNHGISADRLTPHGVGPLAPVASNQDEEGRARNRRVELVKIVE
ncbi:OmpA family protein [Fodinibius sp. AD559]|uniref:OmpA family protein n=1 Tax=Fodinibius sp. AD559 TaxID=3424179 RepID=UPI004046D8A6